MQTPLQAKTIYHIYTHANGSENLFRSQDNYHYFLKKYTEYIFPVAETFAYCLMPNHLHLAVQIREEKEVLEYLRLKKPSLQRFETVGGFSKALSLQFSHLFNGYTQAYNKKYSRKGSLFIPNFKRKEVTNNGYLAQLIAYIHFNPVHHGFVRDISDWTYSSFHAYLFEKPSRINRQYFKELIGNKEALLKFHKEIKLSNELILD